VGFFKLRGRERDDVVRKTYSVAFKQKMVAKLVGKHATSANRLSQETGVSQTALSQWRAQARNLPVMAPEKRPRRTWTVGRKVEILAKSAELDGEQLMAFLEREEVTLAELERWRSLLADDQPSLAATKRIKGLERELARKEKALAEAAALLILKKKLEDYYSADEDKDTDEENDK
jgi:transposase